MFQLTLYDDAGLGRINWYFEDHAVAMTAGKAAMAAHKTVNPAGNPKDGYSLRYCRFTVSGTLNGKWSYTSHTKE